MVKVIAEIGCNHKGDFKIAKDMISVAKNYCNADIVKFQKRTPKELLTEEQYNAPHPNQDHAYGKTYGEHREFLEFSLEQHAELKAYAESLQIEYSSSVWDITSAKEILGLNPSFIKMPSAKNHSFDILKIIQYAKQIHMSLGMTTESEIHAICDNISKLNLENKTVLYSCTSDYPVAFENICLRDLEHIRRTLNGAGLWRTRVGFSGHHLGIAVDIAAMMLGAEYIERHFTLDRTWRGTDHSSSLEPDGLRKLVRDIRAVEKALQFRPRGDARLLECEKSQRGKLR